MAIGLVGTNSAVVGATATNITPATVAGVSSGDLLICTAAQGRATSGFTNTSYTNWTTLFTITALTALYAQAIYRIADGTAADAPPNMAFGTNPSASVALSSAYSGVNNTTPFITENEQTQAAASNTVSGPPLTNTDAAAWGVFYCTARNLLTSANMWAAGAGLTERLDVTAALGTSNNTGNFWGDSNGVVGTGSVTYSATANASVAAGTGMGWAGFLNPAGAALAKAPPVASPYRARLHLLVR